MGRYIYRKETLQHMKRKALKGKSIAITRETMYTNVYTTKTNYMYT